ncbi:HAL/PAL/TAL family ammonia-lyase [Aureimonas glaciei]|uniref:Histidine ammonia-lyase n=1 Tax=Aureimonas glaciei TaxID=1776957 RepID=A0A916XW19_9HYPH|nr:aromatic amino acid ammonia-lyase [Aureimonas glaciei]GGD16290.1 histidine ammonia-lyase [Aureimonas glaciei]
MTAFALGQSRVDLSSLMRLAAPGAQLSMPAATRARLQASRRVVERYAEGDEPIYGLNTGLGGNIGFRLSREELDAFQIQMVRGRCIGIGAPFDPATARLMFLCRIIGLAEGGAGITPAVLDAMVAQYNAGLTPVVPGRGSIGAGDLGLCAHMASAVIGLGSFFVGETVVPAAEALAAAGLQPAVLGPKDGLGLLNSSAPASGYAAKVLSDLAGLLVLATATAALSFEGYGANIAIFDARLAAARPARGQERAAALFRQMLGGSALAEPGAARSIQDALSFRVLSQLMGPMLSSLATAVGDVETEIFAASDNPLVLAEDGLILSTANFHTPAIALSFDTLAIAVTHLSTAAAYRTIKMMSPTLSGLPKYLSPVGGGSVGLNALQKTVAGLHAEIRLKAAPASLDALAVSDTVEDHAPQTHLTIRKLAEQMDLWRMLTAIEALTAAQAVDLRGRPVLAPATQVLFDAVRAAVPMMQEDRETGWDAEKVIERFGRPDLVAALCAALRPSAGSALAWLIGAGGASE